MAVHAIPALGGLFLPEIIAAVVLVLPVLYILAERRKNAAFNAIPLIALSDDGFRSTDKARMQWMTDYRAIIRKGLKTVPGVFRVVTGDGPRIVVPSEFADELRNKPELNFAQTATDGAFGYLPGFQPVGMLIKNNVMQDTIKTKLTRSLDVITPDLKAETAKSLKILLGDDFEWREISLKWFTYHLIARISSSIFFGPEVADSQEWMEIGVPYTMDVFNAARVLRTYTPLVRPIVQWFMPECRRVRAARQRTRQVVIPMVQSYYRKYDASNPVSAPSRKGSMLTWAREIAEQRGTTVNPEDVMLNLAIAAIHSTNENLGYVMLDLIEHPDAIIQLREEIIGVLQKGGWKKTSLSQMHLLDSVLKESQRLHPITRIAMERRINAPIPLSSGFTLPQGSDMFVDTERHFSADFYPNPDEFIPDRFLNIRHSDESKGTNSRSQFVMTSPNHMGFGHGLHACPGRFFVGHELKIALIYLLLKYDWKHTPEGRLPDGTSGHSTWVTMQQKVMFRRRDVEPGIDL